MVPNCVIRLMVLLHSFLPLEVRLGVGSFTVAIRTHSIWQGWRSSLQLCRIPLLDTLHDMCNQNIFEGRGYSFGQKRLTLCTWIDNLFALGQSGDCAVHTLELIRQHISRKWQLTFKASDSKVMQCRNSPAQSTYHAYKPVTEMVCLGHTLCNNNSTSSSFEKLIVTVWKAFFRNFCEGLLDAIWKLKERFMKTHLLPHCRFVWSRMCPTQTQLDRLDRLQSGILTRLFKCPKRSDESDERFYARRSMLAGRHAKSQGRWSAAWCRSYLKWLQHCKRSHFPSGLYADILSHQSQAWLDAKRDFNNSTTQCKRTGTRADKVGKVCPRFDSSEYLAKARIADLPPPRQLTPKVVFQNLLSVESLLIERPEFFCMCHPN